MIKFEGKAYGMRKDKSVGPEEPGNPVVTEAIWRDGAWYAKWSDGTETLMRKASAG